MVFRIAQSNDTEVLSSIHKHRKEMVRRENACVPKSHSGMN